MRLQPGTTIETVNLETLRGTTVSIPDKELRWTHLQFRRFAGCPICNLHLRSIAKNHERLQLAGIREVAVFHSQAETMKPYQGELPFDVVADPEKELYRAFGVESSLKSVANPKAWSSMLVGMASAITKNPMKGEGGHTGLPADFLVDNAGKIVACKYGEHADDQWSVEEILNQIPG
jgi:peroxiredoxin